MADNIFSANVCSRLERKRANKAAVKTSAENASSIAAWIVRSCELQIGDTDNDVVKLEKVRELACVLFGCAAWKAKARDRFIGWNSEQRARGLGLITNNSRFLILPHVRVRHLASHILIGTIACECRSRMSTFTRSVPILKSGFAH